MNFLSHFYFERFATTPERVVGSLLPDLLKNADKDFALRPNNFEDRLSANPLHGELLKGWNGHIEVDRLFHNSDYFFHHTHEIKDCIKEELQGLEIRPSFFAHIALELLLDHQLIQHKAISIDRFYLMLEKVNRDSLRSFLQINELNDIQKFDVFYDKFKEVKYIYEYADLEQITRSLFQICRRLWTFEIQEEQVLLIIAKLAQYRKDHLNNFNEIYHYIQHEMIDFE
ncbi:hypothetical protein LZQ00_12450 [Sphingobacterium sp. SRCM116780]|uniref:ACP phosphodiesterase n=1 Tax=Sphingobacterium sp. SRCM116780 TaxID=2907623 RepID=UPI001F349221|nr:hypothetical protein [Sphingobacterium sp. SRCM116780]UIR55090.1 hypothetical protein LZQ00_12450 [Sphingobacterium sp. SRCM116780]